MIRHRPRRAATVALLAVAAAASMAAVVPVAAAASAGSIVIDSVSSPPSEPGLLSVQAEATSDITSLTVHIDSTPEVTLTDLSLVPGSGSAQDGTWTVQTPITQAQLALGSYQVTVDATDADGDDLTGLSAPDPFFFGLYPTVTIGSSATTLSYSQQSVTFGGRVTAYSPSGELEDVPDQQVSITDSDGGSWSATTDEDGSYSLPVPGTPDLADGTGLAASFAASVASSTTSMQASSPDLELTGDVDPAQVINVALSKSVVDFGTKVTLSGTAQYQSDGIWVPLADSTVDISGTDYYSGDSVPTIAAATDDTGTFKVTLPAQPTTTWTANPAPSQYLTPGDSGLGMPNSVTLTVVLPTQTTRLHVAYNPVRQVTASGCLSVGSAVSSFRDLTAPADSNLYLQYSQTTHGPWRTLGALGHSGAPACNGGTGFGGTVGSLSLSGHYRVSFTGQLLYQRSVSATDYAATVPTRITNFSITPRAVPKNGSIRLSGQLQQKDRSWKSLGGVRVTVYVKPAGSATWYYVTKKVSVSSSGKFGVSIADPVSGHWAVGYPGNASHLECLSRILSVSASGSAAHLRQTIGVHPLSGQASRELLSAR